MSCFRDDRDPNLWPPIVDEPHAQKAKREKSQSTHAHSTSPFLAEGKKKKSRPEALSAYKEKVEDRAVGTREAASASCNSRGLDKVSGGAQTHVGSNDGERSSRNPGEMRAAMMADSDTAATTLHNVPSAAAAMTQVRPAKPRMRRQQP